MNVYIFTVVYGNVDLKIVPHKYKTLFGQAADLSIWKLKFYGVVLVFFPSSCANLATIWEMKRCKPIQQIHFALVHLGPWPFILVKFAYIRFENFHGIYSKGRHFLSVHMRIRYKPFNVIFRCLWEKVC